MDDEYVILCDEYMETLLRALQRHRYADDLDENDKEVTEELYWAIEHCYTAHKYSDYLPVIIFGRKIDV